MKFPYLIKTIYKKGNINVSDIVCVNNFLNKKNQAYYILTANIFFKDEKNIFFLKFKILTQSIFSSENKSNIKRSEKRGKTNNFFLPEPLTRRRMVAGLTFIRVMSG